MSISEYFSKMKGIQSAILEYIRGDDDESNLQKFIKIFDDSQFSNQKYDFKLILLLIIRISNDMHRPPHFYDKIIQILNYLKKDIIKYFSNCEIFNIFESNKRIILYLIDEHILTVDEPIAMKMCDEKYESKYYRNYFCREIKPFNDSIRLRKQSEEFWEHFDKWRRIGENEYDICQLIREDSLADFIVYINKKNTPITKQIKYSICETNNLLQGRFTSLIEFAAFYGSFEIFKYLQNRNCELTPSLYICAIHGENPEIIDLLENKLPLDKMPDLAKDCYFEAIKCYNDQIAHYFADKYLPEENLINYAPYCYGYDFLFNFDFINEKMIGNLSFEKLCHAGSYFYCQLYLSQNPTFDINKIVDIEKEKDFAPFEFFYGSSDLYKKYYRERSSKRKNPLLIQMIEKGYTDVARILLNHLNTDINVEYKFRKKCHRWEYEYNGDRIDSSRDDDDEIEIMLVKKAVLIIAVENNNDEIVQLLLNNPEIDVNVNSISSTHEEVIGWQEAKYHHSSNKELRSEIKKTALYIAVQNNNIEIVKMLLQHPNIDVNLGLSNEQKVGNYLFSYIEKKPLHLAIENNNVDIIKLLLQNKNIDVNALYIRNGIAGSDEYFDEEIYESDISNKDYRCDFVSDYKNSYKRKVALHMAVNHNKIEIVKLLLQNPGINVNAVFQSNFSILDGKTALHFAVTYGYEEMINLLLQNKFIDLNILDSEGKKPMQSTKI